MTLWQDIRHGLRLWVKRPGFTAVVVCTLALGIGANTAIFSVVNALLLRPLPFREPERLVMVWETMPGNDERWVAPGNFLDWREEARSFERLEGYFDTRFNLTGAGEAERVDGVVVSGGLFQLLGAQAVAGRTLTADDDRAASRLAVISQGLWQRRFSGSREAIGRSINIDGEPTEIVGVMPAGFNFPERAQVWVLGHAGVPLSSSLVKAFPNASATTSRDIHIFNVVGRLRAGVSTEQAQGELSTIARRLELEHPETNKGLGTSVVSLQRQLVGDVRPALLVLLGAVSFVLLIACANVANLLLARATRREREMAVRVALGASRLRLIRQLLTESLLLAFAGGALGLLVALWGVDLFVALSPGDIPRLAEVSADRGVLLYALLVSVVTGVAFGLFPALHATRLDLNGALKEGGRSGGEGGRRSRVRGALVVAEVALAQMLLVGAGLLITSFMRLSAVDPGFAPASVLTARVALSDDRYAEPGARARYYDATLERLRALPGVEEAGAVSNLPLSGGGFNRGIRLEGRPPAGPDENITADYQIASPGYFRALGITLLRGRQLAETDDERAPRVAIVNETLARRYFPGEEVLGKRIAFGDASREESWRTVVGVVADVRHKELGAEAFPGAYIPYRQDREKWNRVSFAVRASGDPRALAASLRREIASVDADQPVTNVETMEEVVAASVKRPRFITSLLAALALVAIALAAVGVYGVMSYTVTQRTHEIGVRMALGARPADILRMVVRGGMTLAGLGVATGLVSAFLLTRYLSGLLYGVSAADPLTFAAVSTLLVVVALLACYLPARRATKVDPMVALRYE